MRYAEELTRLLLPLGVYTFAEGSFSLGELQALGDALDALYAHAQAAQRESIVMTAEGEGLAQMEQLFRHRAAAQDAACRVEETGVNRVRVSFPDVMGIPDGFARMQVIIEDILPCQLEISYYFRYCTWAETMRYALRWRDLNAMTWHAWRVFRQKKRPYR